jgi:hypothetical protein
LKENATPGWRFLIGIASQKIIVCLCCRQHAKFVAVRGEFAFILGRTGK